MKFELWSHEGGHTFFDEDNESARSHLEADAKLIWTVEAATWEEAKEKRLEFLWPEPYSPLDPTND